ncbi:hypothetical protein SKAU_G00353140 [Synaphobranchus kaupii]|uniref:Uncharacterized protein n=1 Tax=Synaphobranchus kaupii TaxID=118154 RepID=A0A9Q1IID4_SYNKA|nr:hypothetical protein SKAU_G00353140 [Synaphobranchus kaupii]
MLKKTMEADGRNWDQLLPFVLFAIREVPQASTGFSPFELLYRRRPRGLLDLAKEAWEQQPSPHRTLVEHVEEVQERTATIWPMIAVKTEPVEVQMGEQLTPSQRQDLQDLVNRNRDVFSTEAGHTDLIQHQIITEPGRRVKLRPYRIPEARREAIAAEWYRQMHQKLGSGAAHGNVDALSRRDALGSWAAPPSRSELRAPGGCVATGGDETTER